MELEFQPPGIDVREGIFKKIRGKVISYSVNYLLSAELLFCQKREDFKATEREKHALILQHCCRRLSWYLSDGFVRH